MYKNNEIYICRPWNYIERKNDKILLLWSNIPTWVVVDNDLFLLLGLLNGKNTIGTIVNNISNVLSQSPTKIRPQIDQILPTLTESKIVYKKGDKKILPGIAKCKISNVIVHPTNRCNLNCIMCCNKYNQVPKKDEISIEEIKRFLNEVLEFTVDNVTLSIIGGEPLLEVDKVLEITRHAKEIGFKVVGISTNGTLITREFAKKAKKVGLEVQVSIDGVTEEENDYLRGEGTFKKIIKGIKILEEEEVFVVTSFVCHKGNYKSLEKYYEMALNLGVDLARFAPVKRIGGGLNDEIETVPIDKLLKYAHNLFATHPEFTKLAGTDYFSAFANACRLKVKYGYCGTGLATVLLNPDGSIYPCTGHALPEFKAGNICESSFSDIWQHSPVFKKIRETYPVDRINEKCSSCMVRYWCMGGCRAEAYHCTHKMNSPAMECDNIKKAIIEMIWLLSTTPELGKGKVYRFE